MNSSLTPDAAGPRDLATVIAFPSPAAVPEPSSAHLDAAALAGYGAARVVLDVRLRSTMTRLVGGC